MKQSLSVKDVIFLSHCCLAKALVFWMLVVNCDV